MRGVRSKVCRVAFNDKVNRPAAASLGFGCRRCDSPVDGTRVVDSAAMLRYKGVFACSVTHGTGGQGRHGGECKAAPHSGFSTGLCFTCPLYGLGGVASMRLNVASRRASVAASE